MEDRGGIRRDRTRPARGFRTGSLLFAALLLCASAAACEAGTEDPPAFTPIAADAEGIVAIPVEGITEKARFFEYDADGTVV